jgi:hypothetical protein
LPPKRSAAHETPRFNYIRQVALKVNCCRLYRERVYITLFITQ